MTRPARDRRLSVYDAAYLELALRHRLPLATFDRGLRKAATAEGLGLVLATGWGSRLTDMHSICILVAWRSSSIRIKRNPTFASIASALLMRNSRFATKHAITVADPDSEGEPRFVTLGMDALGRMLVVVHTPRGDRIRIISARKASPGEAEHYDA